MTDESFLDGDVLGEGGPLAVAADWSAPVAPRTVDEVIANAFGHATRRAQFALPRVDEQAVSRLCRGLMQQALDSGAAFIHLEPGGHFCCASSPTSKTSVLSGFAALPFVGAWPAKA